MDYPQRFQNLIECFKYLPGIGTKTAERMAYDILEMKKEQVENFATALVDVFNLKHCHICGNLSDGDTCNICEESDRDTSLICVVHYPKDVFAFEKMKEKYDIIGDVRGIGGMLGVEFVKDKESKEPNPEFVKQLIQSALQKGLLLENAGSAGNVIRFLAPLCMTDEQMEAGLKIFEDAIIENL